MLIQHRWNMNFYLIFNPLKMQDEGFVLSIPFSCSVSMATFRFFVKKNSYNPWLEKFYLHNLKRINSMDYLL